MKKRILSMLLVLVLVVSACAVLASCGECDHAGIADVKWTKKDDSNHERKCPDCDHTETAAHVWVGTDDDTIQKCRDCDATRTVDPNAGRDPFEVELEQKMANYPWSTTNLLMSINNNSNNKELYSGSMAFISGEWDTAHEHYSADQTIQRVGADVLLAVRDRNAASASAAKVNVTYKYATDFGWGKVMGMIDDEAGTDETPDIYYNFIYDMVGASINGYFENILGNEYLAPFFDTYGTGDGNILFQDIENTRGYSWEFMKQLTFSTERMYLIASDYSFDLNRAFFINTINATLLATATDVTGDVNGDGKVDETDFYAMVNKGDWTWTKLAAYTQAVMQENSDGTGYTLREADNKTIKANIDCVLGFQLPKSTGLPPTAFLYSSEWNLVQREVVDGEYVYSYPDAAGCQGLIDTFIAMKQFVGDPAAANNAGVAINGTNALSDELFNKGQQFANMAVVVGKLEDTIYTSMWANDGDGFLVTPSAKVLADQENYRTVVHNIGKVFAISAGSTQEVINAACAYINHQTVASTEILGEYFVWSLGKAAVHPESIEVMTSLATNLAFSLDKIVEDAIGLLYGSVKVPNPLGGSDVKLSSARWHIYDYAAYNKGESVSGFITGIVGAKETKIQEIAAKFIGEYEAE